jgi:hypothetical protein
MPGFTGMASIDALHIACAEAGADYFLTCDDGIIKKAGKRREMFKVEIYNPLEFLLKEVFKNALNHSKAAFRGCFKRSGMERLGGKYGLGQCDEICFAVRVRARRLFAVEGKAVPREKRRRYLQGNGKKVVATSC